MRLIDLTLPHLQRTLAAIDAAARLGSPLISVGFHRQLTGPQKREHFWVAPHPEDSDADENFALACTRLVAICNRAAEHSMNVSLELHEATLLDRSERVLRLLDRTAASNLGVNLDIGNLVRVASYNRMLWTGLKRKAAYLPG